MNAAWCGDVFSHVCSSVCNFLTFESLDLKSSLRRPAKKARVFVHMLGLLQRPGLLQCTSLYF